MKNGGLSTTKNIKSNVMTNNTISATTTNNTNTTRGRAESKKIGDQKNVNSLLKKSRTPFYAKNDSKKSKNTNTGGISGGSSSKAGTKSSLSKTN